MSRRGFHESFRIAILSCLYIGYQVEVPDAIAIAQPQVDETKPPNEPENPLFDEQQDANDPIPSVSQLSDLQPADWAFLALKSLNQRYGCITGYPDNTYLGNRVLSRYEFAAGLNACLNTINQQLGLLLELSLEDIATLKQW